MATVTAEASKVEEVVQQEEQKTGYSVPSQKLSEDSLKQIVQSRKLVSKPGKYQLKVTNVTPYNGNSIVNFNGMTSYHLTEAIRLGKLGLIDEAGNQNLSANIRPQDYLPAKGEQVYVFVDEIITNNGVKGLFVTGVSPMETAIAGKINFDLNTEVEESKDSFQSASKPRGKDANGDDLPF